MRSLSGEPIISLITMQPEKNEKDIYDKDDDDEYWENKLPNDYQRLIQRSGKPLHYTNKKDLYFRLCEGFLGDNGQLLTLVFGFHYLNQLVRYVLRYQQQASKSH